MKPIRLYLLLTLLTVFAAGQGAWAQSTFSISEPTYNSSTHKTTFTITRTTNTSTTETVYYRTVSLGAIAGKHFTETVGDLTFDADHNVRTVEVTETASNSVEEQYHFQTGTTRSYRLDVLDPGGFRLTYRNRSIDYGSDYQHSASYVNKSVTDLVYFDNSGNIQSGSGNKYLDVSYSSPKWIQVTDAGYGSQEERSISTNALYNSSSVLRTYLNKDYNNYKMYATVYFTQKEEKDGYQYIQIYTGNSYDGNDSNGSVKDPVNSLYKACFILSYSPSGSVMSDAHYQFFPHRYDYVDKATEKNNNISHYEFDYDNSHLYQQKFLSNTYKANTSGSLVLSPSTSNINVRFDAGGGGQDHDEWDFKDLKVRLALVDAKAPTTLAYSVAPGMHAKGNTVYVSVAFSEIVKGTSSKLTSNWGDLSYAGGSGSNVMTFSRTIPASATTALNITGFSGITDLAGNAPSSVGANAICAIDPTTWAYQITYDLADGSLPTANPTEYTYETASFTLNNPVRPGYAFAGWTGSNGNTPETTVTIAAGSHGNKAYTANWTPLWGQDNGATGEDDDHAYVISSPAGLDMLAKVVNGTDGYTRNSFSNQFIKLGENIIYNGSENNFTAIGSGSSPFQGTFDGDGHTISGINGTGIDSAYGLFGTVQYGTVKNVTLRSSTIKGRYWVGGIVGFLNEESTISNCRVESTVTLVHDSPQNTNYHGQPVGTGGIVGEMYCSTVVDCISSATVTQDQNYNPNLCWFGGIAGLMFFESTLRNCLAISATVNASGHMGALVGNKNSDQGILDSNYYYNCTVGTTSNATNIGIYKNFLDDYPGDVDGARSVHTLTLPKNVTASGESVVISGVTCYASNTTVTLNAEGYDLSNVSYNDGTDHAITPTAGVYSFTMPAADATVSATLEVTPWSGSGTVADPWVIFYPSQLDLLAKKVNGTDGYTATHFSKKFIKLGADIAYDPEDLNENGENYTPIGTVDKSICFYGTFDGDGHTVSGIRINNNKEYQGLFGHIEDQSVVKNLTLANTVIIAGGGSGGIVGHSNYGTIENCHVESSVSILAYNDEVKYLGGIAGDNKGRIYGCTSSATVSNNGKTGCAYYGGIAGDSKTICYCLVLGANISVPSYKGTITATANSDFNLQINYYSSCTVNGIENASDVGYKTGDITDRDGAVRAIACDTKPAEIGAQLASYPFDGLIAYEHGIYYKGVYYLRHDLAGTAATLTLVQGTKDGVTAWWGTFFDSAAGYTLSEGAAAYTMDAEYQLYRLGTDGRTIPAGTPVVILSTTPEATLLPAGSATADDNAPGGNILIGVDANTAIPSICGLSVNNGEVGFYRIASGILPAHRAGYQSEKAGVQNYDKKNKQEW